MTLFIFLQISLRNLITFSTSQCFLSNVFKSRWILNFFLLSNIEGIPRSNVWLFFWFPHIMFLHIEYCFLISSDHGSIYYIVPNTSWIHSVWPCIAYNCYGNATKEFLIKKKLNTQHSFRLSVINFMQL